MMKPTFNILVGGEAGQGLVTVGQLLAKSLVRSGYHIVVTQSYQSRIRGGHNTFAIRVSPSVITAPQESVDLLIALDAETVTTEKKILSSNALTILEQGLIVDTEGLKTLSVPYKELASGRSVNIASLGIASCILGLDQSLVSEAVDEFSGKHPEAVEENRHALSTAYEWASRQSVSISKLPHTYDSFKRMMMHGNEAIALGAISAGMKFCSFYPMTPATTIPLTLAAHAKKMNLVVEQAEDEIAAINMALGASYAGVPSMTATSGGGFALMVEGVSLAAMTETPIVIVVSQRPGPATSMPTRTEQADLEFVLYSGHGEFPRAIFAPGSVEECFHLTRRAFELAERYQGPIFVLTDQYLADSYRAVEKFDAEVLPTVRVAANVTPDIYQRYAFAPDGISPRLLPGTPRSLVVADSDEHTEDGHLTEDTDVRIAMVEKRLKKGEGLRADVIPPLFEGNSQPDLLLVSWGSTQGSVQEAALELQEKGKSVAVLHFSQVWPLIPSHFIAYLESAQRVICVEGNATGQLTGLIRKESGFEITEKILRYDGLPITPEYILARVG